MSTPMTAARRWAGATLAAALIAAGLQAVPAVAAASTAAAATGAPGPVSNAFALAGGLGGQIDPRTGAFQASEPLVTLGDRGGDGLSLALSYDQSAAALGPAGDRFGLGAGWGLGVPWVDTAGGVHVYPASGGSYAYNASSPTGLAQYPLRDLTFAKAPGTIPARPGVAAQSYVYTLTNLDGTTDRFDASGNLVEQADRFGNLIDLTWRQSGSWWQPVSVADNYGQVTTFDYATPGQVKVTAPVNAEKATATLTLHIAAGRLTGLTDALGQQTSFGYSPVTGLSAQLLSSVTSPAGARTKITYTALSYQPSVMTASTVDTTDAAGNPVLPTLHFNINPAGDGQHNYTGYPSHVGTGSDGLFNSGDTAYRYTTELSNGTSVVDSTYNSLHLLVARKVYLHPSGGAQVLNQTQTYAYPPVPSVTNLPANYAKPTSVMTVYGDQAAGGTRTTITKSEYNDKGQLTSATNAAGTVTGYSYGSYGLPLSQTVTGAGGASVTINNLTSDGKSVHDTTTKAGATVATARARTVETYGYNGFGQMTSQSLAWAPGAKPSGDSGGPDQVDTTQTISTDVAAHTETTVVTTAAGTPQAASATTVTDLVTGQVLSQVNPAGLTTTRTYDALGRPLTVTAPGGLTTKTVYTSPTVITVTAPSGLITQTTTDVTGRTVKVTDNVSGQALVQDPAARTVQTDTYRADGGQVSTTTPAGTTTTTLDPLGRPTQVVAPGGITQTDTYNDVTNTQKVSLLAAGAGPSNPTSATTTGFNDLNQPVSATTSYPDNTPQTPSAQSYDGLGRVGSYTAGNVTATPDYAGTGGLQTGTTLTPTDATSFPGQPVTTGTSNTMNGSLTTKTLTAATGPATGTDFSYNAAGQVASATDPTGHTTHYTYSPDGQLATVAGPDGTLTTYTYDQATGRLKEKDIRGPDGTSQDTGYTYYAATGLVKTVDDPAHPSDVIGYAYDADGHLTQLSYPDGASTKASYHDNGELATTTDITGAVTSFTYNTDGSCGPSAVDLCRASQARDGATLASVAYTYDSLDRLHTVTGGNKVTTTLAYTDASQIKTQTTTAADGSELRADSYTYDAHSNVATHTITSRLAAPAASGRAARRAAAGPAVTTTSYHYDAYNRLISSAVYPGDTATGTPDTTTSYTVNTAGDVTAQDTTTAGQTTRVTDTIDHSQLTARTSDGTRTEQTFNADGAVTQDLAGNNYTYTLAGQIASVTTPAGITTKYTYWPDGTRRAAATTAADGTDHVITYHYATGGQVANDTYTGAAAGTAGPATVTASYLVAAGREARTLDDGSTGPGTGYYLNDAHGSVTAMIDDQGQVTASYAYSDYGQPTGPSTALLPTPAAGPAANAAVNPFTYDGAYTDPGTGTQYLPARTYDPSQGRFLSQDAASQLNRYQAFDTNPSTDTDPTGQLAVPQIVTDVAAAALFLIFGILSWGSLAPVFVAAEVSTAAAVGAVLNGISAVANLAAAATTATLVANDAYELTGTGFLSDSQKEDLTNASFGLGLAAGLTGAAAGAAGLTDTLVTAANAGKGAGKVVQVAENAGPDLGLPAEQDLNPNPKPNPVQENLNPVQENLNPHPDPVEENLNPNPNENQPPEPTGDNNGQNPGTEANNANPAPPEQITNLPNVDLNPAEPIGTDDATSVNEDGQPAVLPDEQIDNLPNGAPSPGNQIDEATGTPESTNSLPDVRNLTDVTTATGEKELNENIGEEVPETPVPGPNLNLQTSTIPLITTGLDPGDNGL